MLLLLLPLLLFQTTQPSRAADIIGPYFTTRDNLTSVLVKQIGQAKKSIHVLAYNFTCPIIGKALVDAQKRGVDVRIIMDKDVLNQPTCQAYPVKAGGCLFALDGKHSGIAHNKVMVFDEEVVYTGSFNYSAAAQERNAENLVGIKDKQVVLRYLEDWDVHFLHSSPLPPEKKSPVKPKTSPKVKPKYLTPEERYANAFRRKEALRRAEHHHPKPSETWDSTEQSPAIPPSKIDRGSGPQFFE